MTARTRCIPVYDLCIGKGADWSQPFIWQADGVAIDLTGYTGRLQIIDPADDSVIADLTTANGKLTLTEVEGKVTAALSYAETRAITQTDAIYDLLLKSPGGNRVRRVKGAITFEPAISADVDA